MAFPQLYTRKGTYRAYHLAAIVLISAFLAGYDCGVAGSIPAYTSFQHDLTYDTHREPKIRSLTIGLNHLGSFVAALLVYPLTDTYGRKYMVIHSTVVLCIGLVIQTVNTHSLAAWYTGRFIAGLGQGALSVITPIYSAEMTPKEIRGRCGSFYQLAYTWGLFLAYWISFGMFKATVASAQWQIPVGLQIVPAGILIAGTLTLPESARWLLSKERAVEAWASLCWVRGNTGARSTAEFTQLQLAVGAERATNAKPSSLFAPQNRARFITGVSIFVFQSTTGGPALAVFAPQLFRLIVGVSGDRITLLTGLFGAAKVLACTVFVVHISERLGRRTLLVGGSAVMAVLMLMTAIVAKVGSTLDGTSVTASGKATVAMIFLNIIIYNCSWGPVPWIYVPEIFPTRLRALGLSVSMLAHWATSFCFALASPYMIKSIGPLSFLIFMGFDVLAAIFCWYFVRETRGKVLEEAAGIEWALRDDPSGAAGRTERIIAAGLVEAAVNCESRGARRSRGSRSGTSDLTNSFILAGGHESRIKPWLSAANT